ncbi:hypothetical protein OG462_24575 [Streptomyces sp. NBC_01077]|uniref:hypothetical protein n=1 Tax=Streptomyces sp. NBC_01077 TaxID=2903746 RepID=UPI003866428B|nr:hypothetical protein OG462_24575 [Streptomyces sp. NBC_01077]
MDDDEESLLRFVIEAPDTAVRWGVSGHDETLFNSKQAYQLLREIAEIPAERATPVLRLLRDGTWWVYRNNGYVQFLGD